MNIQELDKETIDQRFAALFEQVVSQPQEWAETDLVFQDGHLSQGFADVNFMMARDLNGNSFLYSSEENGSHLFSVVSNSGAEFFTIKHR